MRAPSLTSWRAFGVRCLIGFVAACVLTGGSFAYAYWYADRKVDQIPREKFSKDVIDEAKSGEPGNFLIVGSDTREFVNKKKDAEGFGSATEQPGQRSDTIMVVHVDPGAESGMVLSFPRDLYVDVAGIGPAKINAAYSKSPEALVLTIKQNFDIDIHHYLEVNFASFRDIVDAIGRVEVYFPTPARDTVTGLNVAYGGCAALNGEQALAYARSRRYESYNINPETGEGQWSEDPRSDIGRIARQQYFMRTLAQTAISKSKRSYSTATRLVNKTIPSLKADPGLNLRDVQNLVSIFRDVNPQRIPMETMPFISDWPNSSNLYVDDEKAAPLLEKMRTFVEPVKVDAPAEPPDVAPADVSVRVLNGSGEPGVAGTATTALQEAGFGIADGPADADSFEYAVTEIRHSPDNEKAATLVFFYLGGKGRLVESDDVSGVDVEIVVGKDYAGVSTEPTAPVATTTTSTTQPPYIVDPLPGLPEAKDPNAALPLVGCPPGS